MIKNDKNIEKIRKYSPPGTKDCMSNCQKDSIFLNKSQILLVCHFCERIIRVINAK